MYQERQNFLNKSQNDIDALWKKVINHKNINDISSNTCNMAFVSQEYVNNKDFLREPTDDSLARSGVPIGVIKRDPKNSKNDIVEIWKYNSASEKWARVQGDNKNDKIYFKNLPKEIRKKIKKSKKNLRVKIKSNNEETINWIDKHGGLSNKKRLEILREDYENIREGLKDPKNGDNELLQLLHMENDQKAIQELTRTCHEISEIQKNEKKIKPKKHITDDDQQTLKTNMKFNSGYLADIRIKNENLDDIQELIQHKSKSEIVKLSQKKLNEQKDKFINLYSDFYNQQTNFEEERNRQDILNSGDKRIDEIIENAKNTPENFKVTNMAIAEIEKDDILEDHLNPDKATKIALIDETTKQTGKPKDNQTIIYKKINNDGINEYYMHIPNYDGDEPLVNLPDAPYGKRYFKIDDQYTSTLDNAYSDPLLKNLDTSIIYPTHIRISDKNLLSEVERIPLDYQENLKCKDYDNLEELNVNELIETLSISSQKDQTKKTGDIPKNIDMKNVEKEQNVLTRIEKRKEKQKKIKSELDILKKENEKKSQKISKENSKIKKMMGILSKRVDLLKSKIPKLKDRNKQKQKRISSRWDRFKEKLRNSFNAFLEKRKMNIEAIDKNTNDAHVNIIQTLINNPSYAPDDGYIHRPEEFLHVKYSDYPNIDGEDKFSQEDKKRLKELENERGDLKKNKNNRDNEFKEIENMKKELSVMKQHAKDDELSNIEKRADDISKHYNKPSSNKPSSNKPSSNKSHSSFFQANGDISFKDLKFREFRGLNASFDQNVENGYTIYEKNSEINHSEEILRKKMEIHIESLRDQALQLMETLHDTLHIEDDPSRIKILVAGIESINNKIETLTNECNKEPFMENQEKLQYSKISVTDLSITVLNELDCEINKYDEQIPKESGKKMKQQIEELTNKSEKFVKLHREYMDDMNQRLEEIISKNPKNYNQDQKYQNLEAEKQSSEKRIQEIVKNINDKGNKLVDQYNNAFSQSSDNKMTWNDLEVEQQNMQMVHTTSISKC